MDSKIKVDREANSGKGATVIIIIIIIIIIITCLNRMTISVIKTAINMGPV